MRFDISYCIGLNIYLWYEGYGYVIFLLNRILALLRKLFIDYINQNKIHIVRL